VNIDDSSVDDEDDFKLLVEVADSTSTLTDASASQKPVVYVKGSNFFFNVTKKATFQDLVFDGIDAFSHIEMNSQNFSSKYWP
jgi:mitochondrial fission protein ELM1